jgi:phage/plasmid-associated DNA primase
MASEADPGQHFATGQLKSLAGGEPIVARTLHGKELESPVTFTIWIFANDEDLPHLRPEDEAVWERARKIPVGATIPEGERDPRFRERMSSEAVRRAVLAWAAHGAVDYHQHGLGRLPDVVRRAGDNLRADMDDTGGFVESRLIFDSEAITAKDDIRSSLRETLGDRPMPTDRRLARVLRESARKAGVTLTLSTKDKRAAWKGVRFA